MTELKFRAWSDKYGIHKVGYSVTEEGGFLIIRRFPNKTIK